MLEEQELNRVMLAGKKHKDIQNDFPLKVADSQLFLQFVAKFIRFPLSHGVNQIVIHSDGMGNIMKTDEMKVNK